MGSLQHFESGSDSRSRKIWSCVRDARMLFSVLCVIVVLGISAWLVGADEAVAQTQTQTKTQTPAVSQKAASGENPGADKTGSVIRPPQNKLELTSEQVTASRAELGQFNAWVGAWRGIGQVRRNSTQGAWSETGEWVWELDKSHADLIWAGKGGRGVQSVRLSYDPAGKQFVANVLLPGGSIREYRGVAEKNRLAVESAADAEGNLHQLVWTALSDKRMTLFIGIRKGGQEQFGRVSEVGYTREGTKLAVAGAGEPECIVTGGKGTMTVMYKGKTYYVCCTGCRDAFLDDPEGILAEAAAKAKDKNKAK